MFVTLEKKGPVGIVTMNRPEALNALDRQVLEDLNAVLDQVEADPEILVAVVTGAGRSFVAGADIGQMSGFTAVEGKAFGAYGNGVFLKLENLTKPTIAAVNGFALGGGCQVTETGVEYPLDRYPLRPFYPLGVSNHILDTACITARGTLLVMLCRENREVRQ